MLLVRLYLNLSLFPAVFLTLLCATDTFIILNGARGSGKETLLHDALTDRANVMTIDLVKISKASGGVDAKVISALATEVGYFPQFAVLASLSGLIDLASMGLIGTKSGFSSDTSQQLKQILDVTSNALRNIAEHTRKEEHNAAIVGHAYRATTAERNDFIERTKEYGIRDGRLHIVAGNGLLSELGAGLEEGDHHVIFGPRSAAAARDFLKDHQDAHALRVHGVGGDKIPIVVIKGVVPLSLPSLLEVFADCIEIEKRLRFARGNETRSSQRHSR